MKQYQILIGLALVASAIIVAALIIAGKIQHPGRFLGLQCGRSNDAILVLDTHTGKAYISVADAFINNMKDAAKE